jgi:hypothetical protein
MVGFMVFNATFNSFISGGNQSYYQLLISVDYPSIYHVSYPI